MWLCGSKLTTNKSKLNFSLSKQPVPGPLNVLVGMFLALWNGSPALIINLVCLFGKTFKAKLTFKCLIIRPWLNFSVVFLSALTFSLSLHVDFPDSHRMATSSDQHISSCACFLSLKHLAAHFSDLIGCVFIPKPITNKGELA